MYIQIYVCAKPARALEYSPTRGHGPRPRRRGQATCTRGSLNHESAHGRKEGATNGKPANRDEKNAFANGSPPASFARRRGGEGGGPK